VAEQTAVLDRRQHGTAVATGAISGSIGSSSEPTPQPSSSAWSVSAWPSAGGPAACPVAGALSVLPCRESAVIRRSPLSRSGVAVSPCGQPGRGAQRPGPHGAPAPAPAEMQCTAAARSAACATRKTTCPAPFLPHAWPSRLTGGLSVIHAGSCQTSNAPDLNDRPVGGTAHSRAMRPVTAAVLPAASRSNRHGGPLVPHWGNPAGGAYHSLRPSRAAQVAAPGWAGE
jgi:hypothetical protein